MTQSSESKPFTVPTIEEIFALLSALNRRFKSAVDSAVN